MYTFHEKTKKYIQKKRHKVVLFKILRIIHIHIIYTYIIAHSLFVFVGTATPMLKVLAFQKGSHYVFLKHPEIINEEVAEFLELQKKLY